MPQQESVHSDVWLEHQPNKAFLITASLVNLTALYLILTLYNLDPGTVDPELTPGLKHRKWVHISIIDPFAMFQPRELSSKLKSKF